MTNAEWGKIRTTLEGVDREIMEKLDRHFETIRASQIKPKKKSTGRPRKHVDLARLYELQKQRKSLREMGMDLKVSREMVRRILAGKRD